MNIFLFMARPNYNTILISLYIWKSKLSSKFWHHIDVHPHHHYFCSTWWSKDTNSSRLVLNKYKGKHHCGPRRNIWTTLDIWYLSLRVNTLSLCVGFHWRFCPIHSVMYRLLCNFCPSVWRSIGSWQFLKVNLAQFHPCLHQQLWWHVDVFVLVLILLLEKWDHC